MSTKSSVSRDFARAREVRPTPLTGKERPAEVLESAFPAYVGRQVRTGYELMRRSIETDSAVFLTMSGALTPAGLHSSCIIPLIRRGIIDCITTTGANLYHDAHRVIGYRIREIDPNAGDVRLRLARIIRIYDLGFHEETLLETDKLFSALLQKPAFQRRMTTPELHYLLGREIHQIEKALGIEEPCLLSAAYQAGIPIFVGAVQDGSIFLNIVKLRRLLGDAFKLEIDVAEDVFAMAAAQYHCFGTQKRKMAIWILGGGVPKNYTLQGEPLLDQILGVPTDGFDIDVQFCVDPVDNGALSSCPAGEGHTWGKVSAESVERGSMYVHTDVTAVLPWVTHALLSDPAMKKKPSRLVEQLGSAVNELSRQVDMRRKALAKTLSFTVGPQARAAAASVKTAGKKTAKTAAAKGAKTAGKAAPAKAGRKTTAAKRPARVTAAATSRRPRG